MRFLYLVLLAVYLLPLSAQHQSGTFLLDPRSTVNFANGEGDANGLINLNAGFFFADNFVFGLTANTSVFFNSFGLEDTQLNPYLRYYLPVGVRYRPYAEVGLIGNLDAGSELGYFGSLGLERVLTSEVLLFARVRHEERGEFNLNISSLEAGLTTRLGRSVSPPPLGDFGWAGSFLAGGLLQLQRFSRPSFKGASAGLTVDGGYFITGQVLVNARFTLGIGATEFRFVDNVSRGTNNRFANLGGDLGINYLLLQIGRLRPYVGVAATFDQQFNRFEQVAPSSDPPQEFDFSSTDLSVRGGLLLQLTNRLILDSYLGYATESSSIDGVENFNRFVFRSGLRVSFGQP